MFDMQFIRGACLSEPESARVSDIREFLLRNGLTPDGSADFTVCLTDSAGKIAATGSIAQNVLKFIAVDNDEQGTGACATVVSELVNYAYREGIFKLFLFTKPTNESLFHSLGFYTLAKTDSALMMENDKNGLSGYLKSLQKPLVGGVSGAIVANCNPMTNGHLYLMETAAAECDYLHVFIVSEDKSEFPADVRYQIVSEATAHIGNLILHKTSDYIISSATFPTYFIKAGASAERVNADLDLALFGSRIAPELGITRRFVGTEPFCAVTNEYNSRMKTILPAYGIAVEELERKDNISASRVRELIAQNDMAAVKSLVPEATYKRVAGA